MKRQITITLSLLVFIFFITSFNQQEVKNLISSVFSKNTVLQPATKLVQKIASGSPKMKTPETDKATPSPKPTIKPSPTAVPKPNYQLTPCANGEEDCYQMSDVPYEVMSTVEQLNQAVNQYRTTHNLNQLYIDPQICELAKNRAAELQIEFSHDSFSQHVANGDYNYTGFTVIGENIWQGSMSGVHIVEYGWDRSEGHRANLQGDWSRGCAGIYKIYATYIFVK